MGNVFLWKVGDNVVYHTDLEAAARLDGLSRQPDKTVTEEQFSASGGLARAINGKIVLGKTDAEKKTEADAQRMIVLQRNLAETDYIATKIAEGSATREEYAEKIAQRQAWRHEIREIEG
jgi:hypothetical protein